MSGNGSGALNQREIKELMKCAAQTEACFTSNNNKWALIAGRSAITFPKSS